MRRSSLSSARRSTWAAPPSDGDGDLAARRACCLLPRSPGTDWWYEQASSLGLPVCKRLITAVRSRGMRPEHVAGSLVHYAMRHLSWLRRLGDTGDGSSRGAAAAGNQRALLEEIVALLPVEKGAAPTRFLLALFRVATVLHAAAACRDALERRAGAQLEEAALEDLLIPRRSTCACCAGDGVATDEEAAPGVVGASTGTASSSSSLSSSNTRATSAAS